MRSIARVMVGALLGLAAGCNGCDVENVEDAPGTLKGVICHQVEGRPSANAEVTIVVDEDAHSTTTDTDGTFTLGGIPPGQHTATAKGEGVDISFQVLIKSDEETEYLDPHCIDPSELVGKGCISGQVCNKHTGMYVSQAQVDVVLGQLGGHTDVDESTLTTSTDATGVFQLCGIPAGTHTVTVRASGFQKAYPATVTEGQTTEVIAAAACNPFDPRTHCRITGRICDGSDPVGWIEGARVTAQLLDDANPPMPVMPVIKEEETEFSDVNGNYELFVSPEGHWRVTATKGNFVSVHDVECLANEETPVPEMQQCLSASECRFLVAQGVFDRVEDVLGRVGVPTDRINLVNGNPPSLQDDWAFNTFGGPGALDGYCGVFINCGVDESAFAGPRKNPIVISTLRDFVLGGGTLYASDQSYDVIEALFPEKVDWYRNDDLASDAEYGIDGLINASVVDPGLLGYLQQDQPNQSSVAINFAYQTWAVIQQVDPSVQVYLRANVPACSDGDACTGQLTLPDTPLTLRFPVGTNGGQVIFTSFHVETRADGNGEVISTADTDRVMRFLMTL